MNNKIEKKESGISLAEMEERINRLPLTYEDLARVRANLQANVPEYDDLLQLAAHMVIAIVKTKVHGTGDALKTLVKASNQVITRGYVPKDYSGKKCCLKKCNGLTKWDTS